LAKVFIRPCISRLERYRTLHCIDCAVELD
jgi:hypothetical protein